MSFEINYDKQPKKFLIKLDKPLIKRLMDKIDNSLMNNPVPQNSKSIVGKHGVFRIRIGDFRVLYRVNHEKNYIIIVKIDKRNKAYNKE